MNGRRASNSQTHNATLKNRANNKDKMLRETPPLNAIRNNYLGRRHPLIQAEVIIQGDDTS